VCVLNLQLRGVRACVCVCVRACVRAPDGHVGAMGAAGGYLFRLSETTSCLLKYSTHPDCDLPNARVWTIAGKQFTKVNDLYYFNAFWFISTSIMPGGGGNIVAATHFGRLVAALSVMTGVFLQALTTAALGHLLLNSPAEYMALGIMRREASRIQLEKNAANIISLWWRRRRFPHKRNRRQLVREHLEASPYRAAFVAAANMAKVLLPFRPCLVSLRHARRFSLEPLPALLASHGLDLS